MKAAGETLCPLIASTDRYTVGAFRHGIEEGVDLKVRIGKSALIDKELFRDYLRGVMIPKIEEFLEAKGMVDEPAILLMNDCSADTSLDVIPCFHCTW
jgi:hypothetical protein